MFDEDNDIRDVAACRPCDAAKIANFSLAEFDKAFPEVKVAAMKETR